MRYLHAADFGNPAPGGFIPLITAVARKLSARGDSLALVAPFVNGATWHDAVRESGAELHLVSSAREASQVARRWAPDIAHIHFFGWEVPITLKLWTSSTRIIWHAHSTSLRNGHISASLRSIVKYRIVGNRVQFFVGVTQAVVGELITIGAPPRRTVVISNGLERERYYPPIAVEREIARATLGLDGPTILFFGRDPYLKGADILHRALSYLPRMTVITIATPPDTCTALRAHARVISFDRVDDVRSLMWAADVLAVPSRGEGASLVMLEAAACGTPIVASDLAALRETGGGRLGITFTKVGDPQALAFALRNELLQRSPATVVPPRNTEQWADDVIALYGG